MLLRILMIVLLLLLCLLLLCLPLCCSSGRALASSRLRGTTSDRVMLHCKSRC